jgi:hypothetical protein
MNNILTPEDAKKPVTYGDLATILGETVENLCQESIKYSDILQENTFKLIDKTTDALVKIHNETEYKRQRDVRFMMGLIAQLYHCDTSVIHDEYERWCREFDKLNILDLDKEEKKDE